MIEFEGGSNFNTSTKFESDLKKIYMEMASQQYKEMMPKNGSLQCILIR
jgi:hypothetical protein